jgi:hypothetical protein
MTPNGAPVLKVLLASGDVGGLPASIEGLPVSPIVTGMIMDRSDPTLRQRPAPLGYSVGHFAITAGSIGARVVDSNGNVYILAITTSRGRRRREHRRRDLPPVRTMAAPPLTRSTLFAFKPIDFSGAANNFDAAIARSATADRLRDAE